MPAATVGLTLKGMRPVGDAEELSATRPGAEQALGRLAERVGAIHYQSGREGNGTGCLSCPRVGHRKDLREPWKGCACGLFATRGQASALPAVNWVPRCSGCRPMYGVRTAEASVERAAAR